MRNINGVTLFEILISLLLLSIMLLGLDVTQLSASRKLKNSYYFSQADLQLNAMANRLELKKGRVEDYEIAEWNLQNHDLLPDGKGVISGAHPLFNITISWGGATNCEQVHYGRKGCLRREVRVTEYS